MRTPSKLLLPAMISTCLAVSAAQAAVSAEEAAKLGGPELTPMGAERAGNADGSIPEWTGGMTEPPAGYKAGQRMIDPFADEKPLFTITAQNHQQYAENLTAGQIATLKRYPKTFKLPVYPTHRTAAYPQAVYDATKKNATTTQLVDGGFGVTDWSSSVPFPLPKEGVEVYWNHVTRYRCDCSVEREYTQTPVQTNGNFVPVWFAEKLSFASSLSGNDNPNLLFTFMQTIKAPARLEGDVLLVHEYIDQKKEPRNAWVYNPGQRRVRRAPEVAFDGPGTGSDNLRTADDLDMMNGSPERYDWKLIGKKEIYIPYNAYKLKDGSLKYTDILKAGHVNPEYTRYEKHRVWVVEATLKEGARHIYGKRTLYVDEDTWQIAIIDNYDGRGDMWRHHEGHAIVHYTQQVPWLAAEMQYDLIAGRYIAIGLDNEMKGQQYTWDVQGVSMRDYTPAALRRAGK